jgi:hypothetical protein
MVYLEEKAGFRKIEYTPEDGSLDRPILSCEME